MAGAWCGARQGRRSRLNGTGGRAAWEVTSICVQKGLSIGRYRPSGHLLEWSVCYGHGDEAWSRMSECRCPGRSCECLEAEHRSAWDQPHLQLMAATGSRSAEVLSASQRTGHCGRRQVLKANAGWTAMLRQPTSCISGRTESWLQVVDISSPYVVSVRVLRSKSGSCKTSLVRVGSLRRPCGKVKGLSRFW